MSEFRVKVRDKGEITLPSKLRKELNIEKNDILDIDYKDGTIIISQYTGKR